MTTSTVSVSFISSKNFAEYIKTLRKLEANSSKKFYEKNWWKLIKSNENDWEKLGYKIDYRTVETDVGGNPIGHVVYAIKDNVEKLIGNIGPFDSECIIYPPPFIMD